MERSVSIWTNMCFANQNYKFIITLYVGYLFGYPNAERGPADLLSYSISAFSVDPVRILSPRVMEIPREWSLFFVVWITYILFYKM